MTEPTGAIPKCCLTGGLLQGTPQGSTEQIAGMETYVAKGSGDNKKVIVLCTDIFGLGVPNPKLMADQFAAATGFSVYVPDYLHGEFPDPSQLSFPEEPIAKKSVLEKISIYTKMIAAFVRYVGPRFLIKHSAGKVVPVLKEFCQELRQRGVERIGCVGYCLGGMMNVKLAAENNVLDVIVTAHAGNLSAADFEKITQPFALILAEEDIQFDSVKPAVLKILEDKKAKGQTIQVYQHLGGTAHGFAARPVLSKPENKAEFEKSNQETVKFFKDFL